MTVPIKTRTRWKNPGVNGWQVGTERGQEGEERTYTGRHRLAIVVATPLDLKNFQLRTVSSDATTYVWREFVLDDDTQMLQRTIACADVREHLVDLGL